MPKVKSIPIPIDLLRLAINPYSELGLPENPSEEETKDKFQKKNDKIIE